MQVTFNADLFQKGTCLQASPVGTPYENFINYESSFSGIRAIGKYLFPVGTDRKLTFNVPDSWQVFICEFDRSMLYTGRCNSDKWIESSTLTCAEGTAYVSIVLRKSDNSKFELDDINSIGGGRVHVYE